MTTHSSSQTCSAVVGLQWGDEGKGKAVDILAAQHDAVVRYNGGANAGHSVVVKGERFSLHLIPSGILYPGKLAVIGNGVVVDPWKLVEEVEGLKKRGVDTSGLVCSDRAHAVLPYHKTEDALREDLLKRNAAALAVDERGVSEIGTTRRGIGPAYADKAQRACAIRMGDLLRPEVLREKLDVAVAMKGPALTGLARTLGVNAEELNRDALIQQCTEVGQKLAPLIKETTHLLHAQLGAGKKILFEGANGSLLDVDHGTYPYVTGSTCISSGIGPGTGVPTTRVGRILGIMKAYSTRVGGGPFPTELKDAIGDGIRNRGREFGTTTGRPRRVGWLDLVAVKYAAMINGATGLCLTMLDVLAGVEEIKVCTAYRINGAETTQFPPDAYDLQRVTPVYTTLKGFAQDITKARRLADLPAEARRYIDFIEQSVGVKADMVGVGPDREQTLTS
ncbi:MAG TPA: adenylosuccinate synthase [Phycisphaerales bacterium]|nr:adenylosuccinate synthase [Phycisphaerales bacterium]